MSETKGLKRETEQVRQALLWCSGMTKRQVGRHVYVSPATVSTNIDRLRDYYRKQGRSVHSQALLLLRLLEDGVVTVPEVSRMSMEDVA